MTTTTTATGTSNTGGAKRTPTHDIFDVQDREGRPAFWNKVGAAFENRDGSHSVLIYQPGRPDQKTLQLRVIDRAKRPLKEGADPQRSPTHELFFVVARQSSRDAGSGDTNSEANEEANGEAVGNAWKRVGVGFMNRDGSLSLVVDDGNRDGPKARFQMRTHKVTPLRPPQQGGAHAGERVLESASPSEPSLAQPAAEEPGEAAPAVSSAPEQKPAPSSSRPRTMVRKGSASAA